MATKFEFDNFVVTEGAEGELAIAATGTGEKLLIFQLQPQVKAKAAQDLAKIMKRSIAGLYLDAMDPFTGLVAPGTDTKQ